MNTQTRDYITYIIDGIYYNLNSAILLFIDRVRGLLGIDNHQDNFNVTILGISLSLIVPICIFAGRNNILSIRKGIVRDLEALFNFAKMDKEKKIIIPSFELVKYKYDVKSDCDDENHQTAFHKWQSYILPLLLFFLISSVGFSYSLEAMVNLITDYRNSNFNGSSRPFVNYNNINYNNINYLYSFWIFAFGGSYLWSIIYLSRRVSNFDLAPISFFRASVHIVMAVMVSGVISMIVGWARIGSHPELSAVAFLVGMFPKLGIDVIVAKYPLFKLKRVTKETRELYEEIPLDCISGIDPMMKFRLSEYEIEDVQNLATVNPIQLFVETPYGLYEIIDWVAQAQLITAVGSKKFKVLKSIGVRTIFDLEKILFNQEFRIPLVDLFFQNLEQDQKKKLYVFDQKRYDECKEQYFKSIRHNENPKETKKPTEGDLMKPQWIISSEVLLDKYDALHSLVLMMRDELHVRRLRQIWDVISYKLAERGEYSALFSYSFPQPDPKPDPKPDATSATKHLLQNLMQRLTN